LIQKYGQGWQLRYDINWAALPAVICQHLSGLTTADNSHRGFEIVRAPVYTSYKADTSTTSYRYKLFEDLRKANYDVHMMETVGKSEKCVDIQLAVEMLHYATTGGTNNANAGGSYDVALLLTGDKDFMPAMMRTRQKGKAVGLVSMKRGCNRALIETAGLRDFDVLWLEDYLDELVIPKPQYSTSTADGISVVGSNSGISIFTIIKVINDFIRASGFQRVSSRDMGRYLKYLRINGQPLLEEIKQFYGGLFQFLGALGHYTLEHVPNKEDKTDVSYWVALSEDADEKLMMEAKRTKFSPAEKVFFEKYSLAPLQNKETFYGRTLLQGVDGADPAVVSYLENEDGELNVDLPEYLTRDYSKFTVQELKQVCREHGLPVSGVKAALLERLETFVEEQVALFQQEQGEKKRIRRSEKQQVPSLLVDEELTKYLQDLVIEYLHAKGGQASSRDVGRYLAANKSSTGATNLSALKELKSAYVSLNIFVNSFPDIFSVVDHEDESRYEFLVVLKQSALA
jgi:uncharacterized LabA/DUF88 family protein